MASWEYKVIPVKTRIHSGSLSGGNKPVIEDVQNDLNSLGKDGWELVSVQDVTLPDGRRFTVAYLKRQMAIKRTSAGDQNGTRISR